MTPSGLALRPPEAAVAERGSLARSALAYLPSRVVPGLLGIVTLPALSRSLAPEEFGVLALVMGALPYAALLTGEWLVKAYQRRAHHRDHEVEAQATTWLVVTTAVATAALLALAVATRSSATAAVALLLTPTLLLSQQWTALQGAGRPTAYSGLNVAYSCSRSAGMLAAAGLTGRVGPVLGAWLAALWLFVLAGPRLPLARPRRPALAGLAVVGVPLIAASVATNVLGAADRFVVAALHGPAAAGTYAFGALVGGSLLSLPAGMLYLAAYAAAARRWDEGRPEDALRLLSRLLAGQLAASAVVVAVLLVVAEPAIRWLAPPGYHAAADVLPIVAAAQLPAGVAGYLVLVATLRGSTRAVVAPALLAAGADIALGIPAVLVAGMRGAAVTTALCALLYVALLERRGRAALLTRGQWWGVGLAVAAPVAQSLGGQAPGLVAGLLVLGGVVLLTDPGSRLAELRRRRIRGGR